MEAKNKKKVWVILLSIIGIIVVSLFLTDIYDEIDLSISARRERKTREQIERKISNRDFDGAREAANTLWGNQKGSIITQINKAQLSAMVAEFSLKDAEYMAQELDAMPEFFEVLEHNISSVYSKDFRGLYNLLTRYPITATYHSELKHVFQGYMDYAYEYASGGSSISVGKEYYYSTNIGYNSEVCKFNNLVSQALDLAIFDGNTDYIRKLLPLFKSEAVETRRKDLGSNHYDISYKLENKAKADALRKIKEASINL